jgi:hypothetical protein
MKGKPFVNIFLINIVINFIMFHYNLRFETQGLISIFTAVLMIIFIIKVEPVISKKPEVAKKEMEEKLAVGDFLIILIGFGLALGALSSGVAYVYYILFTKFF